MGMVCPPPVPSATTDALVSNYELGNFMAVFPDIVKDLTDTCNLELNKPDVTKWLEKVCADGFVLQL